MLKASVWYVYIQTSRKERKSQKNEQLIGLILSINVLKPKNESLIIIEQAMAVVSSLCVSDTVMAWCDLTKPFLFYKVLNFDVTKE